MLLKECTTLEKGPFAFHDTANNSKRKKKGIKSYGLRKESYTPSNCVR